MRFLLLCLILAMFGCSQKEYKHDPEKNEILAYTKKFEHINGDERYLAIGSYINPILELDENDTNEYILLSVYPEDGILQGSLKVNDEPAVIKKLEDNSKMLKFTEFAMPWGEHYQITANESKKDNLILSYKTSKNLAVTLNFLKVSKSMYWNPKLKLDD